MRALLLLLAFMASASAQPVGMPFVKQASVAYVGPGDVLTFSFWAGLRAFSAATAGTNAIEIRRASDNTTMNITTLTTAGATYGNLDVATATTFCNATNCFVKTFYDKAGSNNFIQNTNAAQPQLIFNCINTSLPCLQGDAFTQTMSSASNVTPATGVMSFSLVGARITATSTTVTLLRYAPSNNLNATTANTWRISGGAGSVSYGSSVADGSAHTSCAILNTSSSSIRVDGGVATTGSANGSNTAGAIVIMSSASTRTTQIMEAGVKDNTAFSSGTCTSLMANQKTYWGTP